MTRRLLFLLFFVMLAADMLGLNLSLVPGISVKNAFLYLVSAGIAIDAALARNRKLELPSIIFPYLLCILYATFTWLLIVLILDYPGYRILGGFMTLKSGLIEHLLVFLIFFYGTLSAKDALWLLKMMLWVVVCANLVSVMDALNLPNLGLAEETDDGRIGGIIGESNQFAAFLALFLPGAAALAILEKGWRRLLAVLGLAASVLAFLMTLSRGGIAGVLLGGGLALVMLRRYVSGRALVSSLAGVALLAIVVASTLVATGYWELLYDRINVSASGSMHYASSGRTFIWLTALSKMADFPVTLITGFGWDTYRHFPDFGLATHNSYLKIYFELGIIGLGLLLMAFTNVLRAALACLADAESEARFMLFAFVVGFSSMLVAIFFVDIFSPWLFIWAYVGVTLRLSMAQVESHAAREVNVASRGVAPRSGVVRRA